MLSDIVASKAVCRICGDVQILDTDARLASAGLAAFTTAHSSHDRFRIDVVTGPVDQPPHFWRLPVQRETTTPTDEDVRSA